jgi:tetratricopeptide (TPR) repeat protein
LATLRTSLLLAALAALPGTALAAPKDAAAAPHAPCTALQLKPDALEKVIEACAALIGSGAVEGDDLAEALRHQGDAYFRSFRMQEAFNNYAHALELRPDWPRALWNYGNAAVNLGDAELALRSHRRALEIDPGYAPAHTEIGTLRANQGDYTGAVAAYTNAIEADPKAYHARLNRAKVNRAIGRPMDAINDLDALLAEDEEAVNATYVHWAPSLHQDFISAVRLERAETLELLGEFEQAIETLKVALERNPSFVRGAFSYSRMQVYEGEYDEALRALDAALETEPDTWSLLMEKARVLVIAQNEKGARDILRTSARFDENGPGQFFLDRAVVWRGLKEHERAEADILTAMERDRGVFAGMMNAMAKLGYFMELPGLDPETAFANAVTACSHDMQCVPQYGG